MEPSIQPFPSNNIFEKAKLFFTSHQKTILLLAGLFLIITTLAVVLLVVFKAKKVELPIEEIELSFNPEGSYGLLLPRRDGNALVLNIKRVSDSSGIAYELAYQSDNDSGEKIDRGVTGSLNMDDLRNEYTQEILFGTCSKGDTMDPLHCVFDKNVENGTLLLRIKQKNKPGDKVTLVYKMNTTWHLERPDLTKGIVTSADGHFSFKASALEEDLKTLGYTLVNDLTGVPKLPDGKAVLGKVYALNLPSAKQIGPGEVLIELSEAPPAEAVIAQYKEKDNKWNLLETKLDKSKLTAPADGEGIFAVLVNSP